MTYQIIKMLLLHEIGDKVTERDLIKDEDKGDRFINWQYRWLSW